MDVFGGHSVVCDKLTTVSTSHSTTETHAGCFVGDAPCGVRLSICQTGQTDRHQAGALRCPVWTRRIAASVMSHVYADDTQLYESSPLVDAESMQDRLTSCVSEVAKWCSSRRLQLNDDKTKMIWFGSRSNLASATHQPVAASRKK